MPTTDPTTAQKITILKHLIHGRDAAFITTATGLTDAQIAAVKRDHGYPDVPKMEWAVDILTKRLADLPEKDRPTRGQRLDAPTLPGPTGIPVTTKTAPTTPAVKDRTAQLLERAAGSGKATTRRLGEKIDGLLADLTSRLTDEERADAEKAARQAAEAKKAKRIAELEAELAALKGKKTPPKATAATPGQVDAKTIRSWATNNGVNCPAVGRIPAAVREQYEAAHCGDAA